VGLKGVREGGKGARKRINDLKKVENVYSKEGGQSTPSFDWSLCATHIWIARFGWQPAAQILKIVSVLPNAHFASWAHYFYGIILKDCRSVFAVLV